MYKYIRLYSILVLTVFLNCKKEKKELEKPTTNIRGLELLEPQYPWDGGVILGVKVNSVPEPLSNIGVLIAKDSAFRNIVSYKTLTLPLEVKTYEILVKSGLELDSTYYYTYSLNNQINKTKADILKFSFGKESKLRIDSISQNTRSIGDTLRLYGDFEGFQIKNAGIGNVQLNAYKESDKVVYIPLTDETPAGELEVYLHSTYQKTIFKDKFSLLTPLINDFPKEIRIGDEIMITGTNFSKYKLGNKLFINNEEVEIKSSATDSIRFVMPNTIKSATLQISIKCNNQTAIPTDNVSMRIKKPQVVEMPSEIAINDFLSITLKDLPKTRLQLFIDKNEVDINQRSDDDRESTSHIYWMAPINNYANKSFQLELRYLDERIKFSPSIKIKDPWYVGSNEMPFSTDYITNPAIVVNNTAYIFGNKKDGDGEFKLWKFNKSSGDFSMINIPFACEFPSLTASEDKVYLYTGNKDGKFYEFNPQTNNFRELAYYPAEIRMHGTINVVKDKVFIVTGHNQGPYPFNRSEGDGTMYAYDIKNNKWEKSIDFPEIEVANVYGRMRTSSFVIGSKLFIVGGALHSGQVKTYSFDTNTNRWETTADLPPTINSSSVAADDYGFIFLNSLYRYEAKNDVWRQVPHIIPPAHNAANSIAFVLDDQMYYSISGYNKLLKVSMNDLKK